MKITNRVVAAAVITVAAVTLAGCTGSSGATTNNSGSDGEPSGTLTGVFFSSFKDTYEQIATDFEKKYPNVDVKFDYQGGDIGALVMTQLQGGTAPDILTSFPGGTATESAPTVASLAASKRIAPLDVSWAGDVPGAWDTSVKVDGATYAHPGALQPLSAMYNQTRLDEFGLTVPTTLDEVYQLCADATAAGVYAYAVGLGDPAGPQMLTYAQLATLESDVAAFDEGLASGDATYADSVWVDQFEIYKEMSSRDCFGEGALGRSRDQAGEEVASGRALGTVDVGAALAPIQAAAPDSAFVVAPMPATNDSADTKIVALPGFVTTINAKAKNPTAAQAFLDFMGEPEQATTYATGFSGVPAIPNDVYEAPAELTTFAELVASESFVPLGTVQAEVQAQLNQGIQSMILGDLTPQQVAEKLDSVYKK
jgi:raffinose/stachyose/melibiose transport system substrate-binding protein